MPLRLGVAEINVLDLDVAWQFYVDTLGIPGRSIGHGGEVGEWGEGRGGPFELDLGPGHNILVYRASVRTKSTYPTGTGVKLAIFTDDIVATVTAWRAKGVEFVPIAWSTDPSGIASSPYGPFIAFRDPFGTVHELLQPTSPDTRPDRLEAVLAGFPTDLVPADAHDHLTRFCADLDRLGRLDPGTDEPWVDEDRLRALLEPDLVDLLTALPGCRLRVGDEQAETVPWFPLADRVDVYDGRPEATLGELGIAWRRGPEDLVEAVHAAFPNVDRELVDAGLVPPRIVDLVGSTQQMHAKLVECTRQLGWWAALAAALLVPLAPRARADQPNAWPLATFVMAAAVGGWTLTVVESVLLAPQD